MKMVQWLQWKSIVVIQDVQRKFVWQSQPKIDGLRTGAGNILLSFAILMAGASASKVLRVLSHMGVACFSLRQFFRHQKVSINIGVDPLYSIIPEGKHFHTCKHFLGEEVYTHLHPFSTKICFTVLYSY